MLPLLRVQPSVRAAPQGATGLLPGPWVPWLSHWNVAVRRGLVLWPVLSQHWTQLHSCLLVLPLNHLVVLPVLQVGGQLRVLCLLCPLPWGVALLVCLHERGPCFHDVVADGALAQGRCLVQTGLPVFLYSIKDLLGGMVQQVADHFLAASADCMVQERATLTITVHEVTPSLVQLLELTEVVPLGSLNQLFTFRGCSIPWQ